MPYPLGHGADPFGGASSNAKAWRGGGESERAARDRRRENRAVREREAREEREGRWEQRREEREERKEGALREERRPLPCPTLTATHTTNILWEGLDVFLPVTINVVAELMSLKSSAPMV